MENYSHGSEKKQPTNFSQQSKILYRKKSAANLLSEVNIQDLKEDGELDWSLRKMKEHYTSKLKGMIEKEKKLVQSAEEMESKDNNLNSKIVSVN